MRSPFVRSHTDLLALLSFLALGCSSDRDMVEKRLSTLREEITRVQAENDRLSERVDALEVKQAAAPSAAPAAAAGPTAAHVERPPLKVVKLVPGDAPEPSSDMAPAEVAPEERPDAPGTRPVIRVRGKEPRSERSDDSAGGLSLVRQSASEEAR